MKLILTFSLCVCFGFCSLAGVVYELDIKDQGTSMSGTVYVQDGNMKMVGAGGKKSADMIFRSQKREVVAVNHDDKSYMVMDKDTMGGVSDALANAQKQMEQALKNVPEEQRAMVEQMMKQRMPKQVATPKLPKKTVSKHGAKKTINGFPCVRYDVTKAGVKSQEIWVTPWKNVKGGDEVRKSFEEIASFFEELMAGLGAMGANMANNNPFDTVSELGGFPIHTIDFDEGGDIERETTLRSATRRTLDPADFEPPAGYKVQSMGF